MWLKNVNTVFLSTFNSSGDVKCLMCVSNKSVLCWSEVYEMTSKVFKHIKMLSMLSSHCLNSCVWWFYMRKCFLSACETFPFISLDFYRAWDGQHQHVIGWWQLYFSGCMVYGGTVRICAQCLVFFEGCAGMEYRRQMLFQFTLMSNQESSGQMFLWC